MGKRAESGWIEVRHRQAAASAAREQPERVIIDVTSRADEPWVRFSPFYPHGGIPVPGSDDTTAASVEGIWQGLKVFETTDVDPTRFEVTTMRNLKRTVRKHGRCLGHRFGVDGEELLGYAEARSRIYLPTYAWVLEHRLQSELAALVEKATAAPLTLLDYETNTDVDDLSRPLSHAGLVAVALRQALGHRGAG